MFNGLKKLVLSSMIKKAITPASLVANTSGRIYVDLIATVVGESAVLIQDVGEVIYNHSEEVAEAILLLQPLLSEIKEKKIFESWMNQIHDQVRDITEKSGEEIITYSKVLKEAFKE